VNLTVRLEANAQTGLGHLLRTQAVIEALREQTPVRVTFVMRAPYPCGETVVTLPQEVSDAEEGAWIAHHLPETDALLADLFQPTVAQLRSLRRPEWRLACIDDDTPHRFDSDLLVNSNLNTVFVHDRTPTTRYLSGSEVLLLRRAFQNPAPRRCREEMAHLLLAFGGSDPAGLTLRVCDYFRNLPDTSHLRVGGGRLKPLPQKHEVRLRGLNSLEQDTSLLPIRRVTVLVGGAYPEVDVLRARLSEREAGVWEMRQDVADVRGLLEAVDVGIIAAGGMLYEAATTGLPTLTIGVNAAQEREAVCLAAQGATRYLGRHEVLTPQAVFAELDAMTHVTERQAMAAQAQRAIDGGGAKRVAEAIAVLHGITRP
jgi:spore coat polysaccharide biosynthesis predicted glycosyltransferase SpsG